MNVNFGWIIWIIVISWCVRFAVIAARRRRLQQGPRQGQMKRPYSRQMPESAPPGPAGRDQHRDQQDQRQPWPGPFPDAQPYTPPPGRDQGQQQAQPAAQTQDPPPLPSAPQGFRARRMAELDQQFTDGKIALEDYMKARDEIMRS